MSKGDALVEQGAEGLRALSEKAARRGGLAGRLAEPLAEDADFLRKLKPSLIKARARGGHVSEPVPSPKPEVRASTDGGSGGGGGGKSLLVVVAGALAAGVATAKVLDWRGHAHPRG
jgi:hypothetical protein